MPRGVKCYTQVNASWCDEYKLEPVSWLFSQEAGETCNKHYPEQTNILFGNPKHIREWFKTDF